MTNDYLKTVQTYMRTERVRTQIDSLHDTADYFIRNGSTVEPKNKSVQKRKHSTTMSLLNDLVKSFTHNSGVKQKMRSQSYSGNSHDFCTSFLWVCSAS